MIRAVLDANVLASGVLGYRRPDSAPGEIVRRWRAGAFLLVMSDHLMGEVERTLADPFFAARIPATERTEALDAFKHEARLTEITDTIAGVASHVEDDLVLATAMSAIADYLVTGDKQLLRVGAHHGVALIRPRDFLTLLEARQGTEP